MPRDGYIQVETIAGGSIELPIAGLGARSLGFSIDLIFRLILAAAWLIASGPLSSALLGEDYSIRGLFWFRGVPALALYFLYHPVLEIMMSGRTPGKRKAGVMIVTLDGRTPSAAQILIRNVFRLVDAMPSLYLFGVVSTLLTKNHVRIGDIAAGTVLIYEQTRADDQAALSTRAHGLLSYQQQQLLADLLLRWKEMEPKVRVDLGQRMLALVKRNITADAKAWILELMVLQALRELQQTGSETITVNDPLSAWIYKRLPMWRELQSEAQRVGSHRSVDVKDIGALVQRYRALGRHAALAQQLLPNAPITATAQHLILQTHHLLVRPARRVRLQLREFLSADLPAVMAQLNSRIVATAVWFLLTGASGWVLVSLAPETASLFLSESMMTGVQNGELWTDHIMNVMPSSIASFQIMTNNIVVALTAFALGAFYGLGTLYIIGVNGMMLGATFAYTHQYHLSQRLLEFIVAHGVVELSVIVLAGAAGIQLGEALIRPGLLTRAEAFQNAVTAAFRLISVCAVFLVGAGLLEGFVSPNSSFSLLERLAIGSCYGVAFWSVLYGRVGRRSESIGTVRLNTSLPTQLRIARQQRMI